MRTSNFQCSCLPNQLTCFNVISQLTGDNGVLTDVCFSVALHGEWCRWNLILVVDIGLKLLTCK